MTSIRDITFASQTLADLVLDHQVDVDARSGAARITIHVPVTIGRGMQPDLSVGCSSGGGNTPFGLGWSLSGGSSVAISLEDGCRATTDRTATLPRARSWFHGLTTPARATPRKSEMRAAMWARLSSRSLRLSWSPPSSRADAVPWVTQPRFAGVWTPHPTERVESRPGNTRLFSRCFMLMR